MTNRKLAMMTAVVAVASAVASAGYEGVCDQLAAAEDDARYAAERQRWAAEQERRLAQLRSVGADATFAQISAAVGRVEQGLGDAVGVAAELARARQVYPADERGVALQTKFVALRTRRHATHEGAAATMAYLQALGLP
jgi:hypothetical protein